MDNCPKCGSPTLNAPGIGPYCPNSGCDVLDNLLQVEAPTLLPMRNGIEQDLLRLYQEARRLLERMLPQVGTGSKLAGEVREFLERGSQSMEKESENQWGAFAKYEGLGCCEGRLSIRGRRDRRSYRRASRLQS